MADYLESLSITSRRAICIKIMYYKLHRAICTRDQIQVMLSELITQMIQADDADDGGRSAWNNCVKSH